MHFRIIEMGISERDIRVIGVFTPKGLTSEDSQPEEGMTALATVVTIISPFAALMPNVWASLRRLRLCEPGGMNVTYTFENMRVQLSNSISLLSAVDSHTTITSKSDNPVRTGHADNPSVPPRKPENIQSLTLWGYEAAECLSPFFIVDNPRHRSLKPEKRE